MNHRGVLAAIGIVSLLAAEWLLRRWWGLI